MRALYSFATLETARIFSDFLITQGIENEVREDGFSHVVWIYDDLRLPEANSNLQIYLNDPQNPVFAKVRGAWVKLSREKQKEETLAQKQYVNFRKSFASSGGSWGSIPVTVILIALSVLVAVVTRLGDDTSSVTFLYITDVFFEGTSASYNPTFHFLANGEIWRLFTPMFLHFGFLHVLFNMQWMTELGPTIERKHGSAYFIILVLFISGVSNAAQFVLNGPLFGGMSGVVYGLLGFLWIRGKCDPYYGMQLNSRTVVMMVIWFFLGLFQLIPNMANTVHGAGLLCGMLWGYLSSGHWKKIFGR